MASTNTVDHNQKPSYGGQSFEVPEYDVEKIEPDAYPGQYEAKLNACKWKMTSSAPARPMIVLEWKIMATEEESEECQKSLKATVSDFIVLANDRSGNSGKQKLRALRETLELEVDFSRMNPDTVKVLAAQLKGRTITIWVTNREDADGNVRTNVSYTAPRGAGGEAMAPMGGEEEEEEEEETETETETEAEEVEEEPEPPRRQAAAKSGAAKKSAVRR